MISPKFTIFCAFSLHSFRRSVLHKAAAVSTDHKVETITRIIQAAAELNRKGFLRAIEKIGFYLVLS